MASNVKAGLTRTLACCALLVALGGCAGLGLAGQEIARQSYLAAGLWRTSLWVAAGGAWTGVLAGALAGAVLMALPALWSAAFARRAAREGGEGRQRLAPLGHLGWECRTAVFLAFLTAIAVLIAPYRESIRFGPPYVPTLVALAAGLWVLTTCLAASAAVAACEQRRERWFRFRWFAFMSFAWAVLVLRVWSRVDGWERLAQSAAVALIVCGAAYSGLSRYARSVHDRLGRRIGGALMGRFGRLVTAVVLAGLVVLWVAGRAAMANARSKARADGRSVILIGIDTVRRDRTSLVSADERDRDLTPNVRRLLGERGTVFPNAVSQAPWTLPAFASMFTGLYPEQHGAEKGYHVLAPSQLALAEIMREAGYRTMGVVSGEYVAAAHGMTQGFELFDESQASGNETISSAEVTDRAIEFLRAREGEPLFAFVHYFDPHWIYRYHEEYGFADGYEGWLREPSQNLNDEDEFERYVGDARPAPRESLLAPEEIQYLRDLYDEEIAFMDGEIGRLLRHVSESGLAESSLIILVADHGEEFMEHGHLGHGERLYDHLIGVPLVVAAPGEAAGSVCTETVETRTLFTTILEFVDLPAPEGSPEPLPLRAEPRPGRLARSSVHSEAPNLGGRTVDIWRTCIQDGRWKLVKSHLRQAARLFDLHEDPGETRDCSAAHPSERRRLERELDRLDDLMRSQAPRRPVPEVDEARQQRLRDLGYLR